MGRCYFLLADEAGLGAGSPLVAWDETSSMQRSRVMWHRCLLGAWLGAAGCSPGDPASSPHTSADAVRPAAPAPRASPRPIASSGAPDEGEAASITLRPVEPTVDPRGCVRNLKRHAADLALDKYADEIARGLGRPPQPSDFEAERCTTVASLPDIDGDGAEDSDVSICLPPGGHVWTHYLYFSNRGCSKAADQIAAAELTVLDSKSHGVRDVETVMANGCAGNDFTWTRFSWTGTTYWRADTATCFFCSEVGSSVKPPRGANQHPYCKKEKAQRATR
jgi:hypothetical protein